MEKEMFIEIMTHILAIEDANEEVWYTWGSNEWSFKNKQRTIKIKEK